MTDTNNNDNKFLEEIHNNYVNFQIAQKQRGINDFNIFTTLLKPTDEVRLHSRFIESLLNVEGDHYQGSLFLDLFLKEFKPKDFEFDSDISSCHREHDNMDIYLTDGSNHIIIENKINAPDQENQLENYINNIVEENKGINGDRIWFCYLTPDRKKPKPESLGDFTINKERTRAISKNITVIYSNVHYKSDIPSWLNDCLSEVSNLKDLSLFIDQYITVIKIITGKYESKVVSFIDYLKSLSQTEKIKILECSNSELKDLKAFKKIRNEIMGDFFNNLRSRIENSIDLPEGWSVDIIGDERNSRLCKKEGYPFRIKNPRNNLLIGLEFIKSNYEGLRVGVVRRLGGYDIDRFIKDNEIKKIPLGNLEDSTKWWLYKEEVEGDFWREVLEDELSEKKTEVLDKLLNKILKIVKEYKDICNKSSKIDILDKI